MTRILGQVRHAISQINPNEVREAAEHPLRLGLYAADDAQCGLMESFLLGDIRDAARRAESARSLARAFHMPPARYDVEIREISLAYPPEAVPFDPHAPERMVKDVLSRHEQHGLALARLFPPFREKVVEKSIHQIARENALFSVATAIPNVAPLIGVGWALGEFGSDTAVLTVNQVRLAFLLAAANGRRVGFKEQRGEIASIIAGGFGWRAIARQLISKIPMGGGVIPKAAIAYAGTVVVGRGIAKYYQFGRELTSVERRKAYEAALEKGREVAGAIVKSVRRA